MTAIFPGKATSEDAILARIDKHFPNSHPSMLLGRGDDCAVFNPEMQICASSDLFLENVHFRSSYFTPEDVGFKSLAVNISDIAAMGAKPLSFTLSLGLPDWVNMTWLDQFLSGMAELAHQQDMLLAGGDISRADSLLIAITAFGECPPGRSLLLRGGNMPGDILFVIGQLGLARVGLLQLEAMGRNALEDWPEACAAHLRPSPQTGAGLMLARAAYNSRPPALMDVSDGLASDLPRLLGLADSAVGLGADIHLNQEMIHPEVLHYCELTGKDPVLETFTGGEDYALLGACAPDMASILHAAIPDFRIIGEITKSRCIYCNGMDMSGTRGFDHFTMKTRFNGNRYERNDYSKR